MLTRFVRLGIRFAAWVTPHVQTWHRQRNVNITEGRRHLDAGNWPEAQDHLSLALDERRHPPMRQLELLLGLALAQRRQGRFKEAERTVFEANDLAVRQRSHDMHLAALDALADVQIDQGKYEEAKTTTQEIERLENARPNPDAAQLARATHKLGTALVKSGQPAEAFQAFQRAVQFAERAFGAEHVETAASLGELGMLHRQKGNHLEAQRHLRRALQIHRTASGPDSHDATQALYHLAASLQESGDLHGAVREYERMLALRERQIGADPNETADAQLRLAQLYMRTGRSPAARELLTQAVNVLELNHSPRLPIALEALADALESSGRLDDATRLRVRAANLSARQRADSPAAPQIR